MASTTGTQPPRRSVLPWRRRRPSQPPGLGRGATAKLRQLLELDKDADADEILERIRSDLTLGAVVNEMLFDQAFMAAVSRGAVVPGTRDVWRRVWDEDPRSTHLTLLTGRSLFEEGP